MTADASLTRVARAARSAPATSAYVLILLATTVLLRHVPAPTATRLLTASSTDVNHLGRDPLTVLVASAAWLPGREWLPYAVVFALVLAPLERRFGGRRATAVFLSGHVGATLLTELPIAAAVALHLAAPSAATRIDVGASYGMFAAVGASTALLARRQGAVALACVLMWLLWQFAGDADLTACGHLLSLGIGAAWCPLLRREIAGARVTVAHPSGISMPSADAPGTTSW